MRPALKASDASVGRRIVTIDFEGSSLFGYPIEVGIAAWTMGELRYRSWSTLIAPPFSWIDDETAWTEEASELHRIPRASLKQGMKPAETLRRIAELSNGAMLTSDAMDVDCGFMAKLALAAGATPLPIASDYDTASTISSDPSRVVAMMNRYPGEARSRHRAEPDAVDTLLRIAHGSGTWPLPKPSTTN